MKNEYKEFEQRLKEEYLKHLSRWIAKLIKMHYVRFGNSKMPSYIQIYNMAHDSFDLTNQDKEIVYKLVNRILPSSERIFLASCDKNQKMYIINSIGTNRFML